MIHFLFMQNILWNQQGPKANYDSGHTLPSVASAYAQPKT